MKKDKRNKRLILLIGFFSIILITCIVLLLVEINKPNKPNQQIKYSQETKLFLEENNLWLETEKLKYSKTLETIIEKKYFNKKYFNEYYEIDYVDYENFPHDVSKLLEKNYTPEEINYLIKEYDKKTISQVISVSKFDLSYLKTAGFNFDLLERYINYQKSKNISIEDTVKSVNNNLDVSDKPKEYDSDNFYKNIRSAIAPDSITTLVNKEYALAKDFVPKDLVNFESKLISKRVVEPLKDMFAAAKKDGYHLCTISSYRSYNTQASLFNGYIKRDGRAHAERYSARPGHSEHQLGLVTDLCTTNGKRITAESPVYPWLFENAHKYGFIIRYPKGKTGITGYNFEPWHVRYIGIDHATKVKELDITYDEYYDIYIKER